MSEENVKLIRRISEAFTTEQEPPVSLAPGFVWDMSAFRGWPGRDRFHGPDGFMEFFGDWIEAYEEWTQDIGRVIDAGDECVVTVTRQRGRLRGADTWVELRYGIVYTVKNGLIYRADAYVTPEEALEAAGLSESGG